MSDTSGTARKLRLRKAGLCYVCGLCLANPNMCLDCAAKHQALVKARRARLKADGLCVSCGARRTGHATFCEAHHRSSRESVKIKIARRRAHGLCSCGKPARPGRFSCARCAQISLKLSNARFARYKAQGRCRCGKTLAPSRSCCSRCLARSNAAARDRMNRRVSQGRCQGCGKPRTPQGTARECRPCANAHSKRESERQKRRRAGIPSRRMNG